MLRQWKEENPFRKLLEGVRSDQWREQATWLTHHAATAVGDRVTAALTESLLEGKLTLFGIASAEPLGNSRPISADKLRKLRLDVSSNCLTWPDLRRIAFTDVTVGRALALTPNPSGGQSFDDADAILVVEMRQLIVRGTAESVIAAAKMVVGKAMIKLTSATGTVSRKTVSACREDELTEEATRSVVSRLCRDYGAKYHPRGSI